MESRAVQLLKVLDGISVKTVLNLTFFSWVQVLKTSSPIVVTFAGNVNERKAVELKADLPILVTFSPNTISCSLLLLLNKLSGISVTDTPKLIFRMFAKLEAILIISGMVLSTVTSRILSHSPNALFAIWVICLPRIMERKLSQL